MVPSSEAATVSIGTGLNSPMALAYAGRSASTLYRILNMTQIRGLVVAIAVLCGVGGSLSAQGPHVRALIDTLHRAHGGLRLDSIMNGADDDSSGTVLALEIGEAYALPKVKPERSLLFVFHAAEETGLFGADYFADDPTVPRDRRTTLVNRAW